MVAGKKLIKATYLKNVRNSDKEDDKADDGDEDLVAAEVLVKNATVLDRRDDDFHGGELTVDSEHDEHCEENDGPDLRQR